MANIEPLIHDPASQNALTDDVMNEITSRIDVTAHADQATALLPASAEPPTAGPKEKYCAA